MARNFDGVNDDLDAGNPAALQITGDQITVSAWIRIASKTAEKKTVAKWADSPSIAHSYLLSIAGTGNDKAIFAIDQGGLSIAIGVTALDVGMWYHLAGTYDGVNVRIYVNGVQDGISAQTGDITSTTSPVRIGQGSGTSIEQPFDGDIGHVHIRNVALSDADIASLAEGVNPRRMPVGLVAYWPLNGQSPELDIVEHLNMTVTGTTIVDEPPKVRSAIVAPG